MDYSPKRLIKLLEERGWTLDRITGSHHIYKQVDTKQTVPIPVHGSRDLGKGLFLKILKDAGIDKSNV